MSFLSFFARIGTAYNNLLERHPIKTKALTSGVMYSAGDIIAQAGAHYNENKEKAIEQRSKFKLDYKRALVFFVYGTVIAGPLYHIWFNNLDRLPGVMYQMRMHRQRSEIMKAYSILRRNNIEVNLKLDQLPTAKPFHKYTQKAK